MKSIKTPNKTRDSHRDAEKNEKGVSNTPSLINSVSLWLILFGALSENVSKKSAQSFIEKVYDAAVVCFSLLTCSRGKIVAG